MDHLHALVAVLEEGTFEAAARRLRVTASAVSQRIKAMEQIAGQVLVQRVTPVTTTAAGDVVLRYARQMQLLEADTTRALDDDLLHSGKRSIALAVNADSLATWFLEALAALPPRVDVVFTISREDQEHTTNLLRAGTVMAAVTSTPEPVQGCRSEKLGIMRYRAVCSPGFRDRWLGGIAAPWRLAGVPVVNFDRRDLLQDDFFRRAVGQDLDTPGQAAPRHFIPTSADFARAVALGLGWGLLPEQQCLAEIARGDLVELAPAQPVDVPLYWQRWNLDSELLDDVTDAVRSAAATRLHAL
ncbi:LysR family transcriptional regulator ArgP [Cryobacterium melibiosiphilum]|nr:LysR family transcriptional regulator ArgP [Cryobacterium melibiosiphilum]